MVETEPSSLAELLRLAKKQPPKFGENNERWLKVSREVAGFEEGNAQWPSAMLLKCLDENEVPFSAISHILALAIRNQDSIVVEKIVASSFEVDDALLVDAVLFAVRDKKPTIIRSALHRNLNQSPAVNRLRQSASSEECLCLLEEAVRIRSDNESAFSEQSFVAWVQAALDSHFFDFAQRLGFSNAEENTSESVAQDTKTRLDAILEKLLSFVDDRTQHSLSCDGLLTLVESSLALVNNRMPSASRYHGQNGKTHRDYAVRMIVL